jgi:hypothetical protein
MPIKVTCACGQSFAAKDELAGRTVKCPKCSRPLAIPATGATGSVPAPPAPASPQQSATAASVTPAPATSAYPSGDLFDEVGLASTPVGAAPCPGCRAPLQPGAILCVQCGYNLKLGRKMEMMRIGADGSAESGTVTDMVLNRAARTIEEEKEEERKKTREGLPWWGYLLILLCLVGFMAMMMFIPQQSAILIGGLMIVLGGTALSFYGWLRIVIKAFNDDGPLQGIGTIICCPYFLVYTIMHWDECSGCFFMWLGGNAIQFVGFMLIQFLAQLIGADEPEALAPLIDQWPMIAHIAWMSMPLDIGGADVPSQGTTA